MTLVEYRALKKGAMLRDIDAMELNAIQAYNTAIAGGFDDKGKPLVKSFKDLFDRKKMENAMLGGMDSDKRKANAEAVENFRQSKNSAEEILNRRYSGKEETDVN